MPIFAPVPLHIQQETQALPERERAALARAQAAWMTRQQSLDPRHATYSQRATPDDLERALRLLRGLFDLQALADLPLSGALHWINILMDMALDAEERGQQPTLPLPYLFLFRRELDDLDAVFATPGNSDDSLGGFYGGHERSQQRSNQRDHATSSAPKRRIRNGATRQVANPVSATNGVTKGASPGAAGLGERRAGGHQPQPAGDGQGAPQDARRRLLRLAGLGGAVGSRPRGRSARA